MATATPDLRLRSQLTLVPNLNCLVTELLTAQDINPIAYLLLKAGSDIRKYSRRLTWAGSYSLINSDQEQRDVFL